MKFEKIHHEELLQLFLNECLPVVEQQGWKALTPTFQTSQGSIGLFFPGGVEEMVLFYQGFLQQQMTEKLSVASLQGTTVRIVNGIQYYLLSTSQKMAKQTVRLFAHPFYVSLGMRCLYAFVNTLWYAAGDRSTDFNFYTKRGLLAMVFTSTELYWIQDTSPGYYKTWQFLDQRLQQVYQLSKWRQVFSLKRYRPCKRTHPENSYQESSYQETPYHDKPYEHKS
jgi:ubiquinone biosynthesis protein COQ9